MNTKEGIAARSRKRIIIMEGHRWALRRMMGG